MDFKQIEAFVNVIKYKNFSRAADASFLTQPTISTHINSLEKELGVRLIDRTGKEAKPTPPGAIFYKYAVGMLNAREKAVFSIQSFGREIKGVLEIQTSSVPGGYLVPQLISEFGRECPDVQFYVEQSDSRQAVENLLQQKGEIGFTGRIFDNELEYEPLARDEMVLVAPNSELFADYPDASLEIPQWINAPILWREEGSGTRQALEQALEQAGVNLKRLNIRARMNNLEAIKRAVSEGMGIALLSRIAVEHLAASGRVRVFSLSDLDVSRMFYLVHNKKVTLSPPAELFRTCALDYFHKGQV